MFSESYPEFMVRWHLYRRWKRPPNPTRKAEYTFYKLMKSAPRGGLFVDLGANVGDVTNRALAYGMRVIAFEPDPVARKVLVERFGRNDRVTIIPKAVGASARTAVFYQRPDIANVGKTQSSSLLETHEHASGSQIEVEVIDLVQFLRDLREPVSVIKMDIEGAEVECLEALFESGIYRSIGAMLVETHDRLFPQLTPRLDRIRNRITVEQLSHVCLDWG
ncbi:FkbM family methyltransferase [Aminobacter sp. MDW-2]|uniref:FkbM family methyltransferase n=1 Tax=Aminobacter sp. MDW-2 TaxID=2666139 RepID=UPI0012AF3520|nr:FkbM family methyltransferase [Aminobacter sp. MDW-2]MRX33235.1 FkbM family methyltransferase [Aminobacter sp. MDW-2]QNH36854.1 FkbM family methyltransferase [Aminobacter sp. MDW-2]